MKVRFWQLTLDIAILLTRWGDALYLQAWPRVYPPRAGDDAQVVRAISEDWRRHGR